MATVETSDLFTAWTASPLGLAMVAFVGVPYAALWWRARRAGGSPSVWRLLLFVLVGLGSLAYAVCGPLTVYRSTLFWVGALQVAILSSLTPVGIALGHPCACFTRAPEPTSLGPSRCCMDGRRGC